MKKLILTSIILLASVFSLKAQTVEIGEVTTNHTWKTVNFTKSFTDPVVVAGPPAFNGSHKSIVRIQNVTATSFQIRVQEWDYQDGSHANEQIHYMVVEKGTHTLGSGAVLEAGTFNLTNGAYSTINFTGTHSNAPVVLTSVISENELDAVTTRVRNINTNSFQIKMQEQELNDQTHAQESISYIALRAGTETNLDGYDLSIGTQAGVDEVWDAVPSTGYTRFIAGFQTVNGGDTGAMRMRGSVGTNLEIFFEEEQSANSEVGHVDETAGFILARTHVVQSNPLQLEKGTFTANSSSFQTVNLTNTYVNPVIVATPAYPFGSQPAIVQVQNVTASSFDIRLAMATNNGSDSLSCPVHYFVVEEGTYTVAQDGIKMEAVTYSSTVTDRKNNWNGETRTYQNSYTSPIVFGQVMTANDARASVFWASGGSQNTAPTATTLKTGKHIGEDTTTTRADETIGYIVIEAGSYTVDGIQFSAALGADIVKGMTNERDDVYTVAGASLISSAILSAAGMDGGDGGWPVLLEPDSLNGNSLKLIFEEDIWGDTERGHTTEEVAYLAFTETGYSVNFTAGANGSLTGDSNQTVAEGGSTTAVTAVPDSGYIFEKWSDDNTQNPRTLTNVTSNINLTAIFIEEVIVQPPVTGTFLSQDFTFDDLNRRDTVTLADGSVWDYNYDGLGNLEQAHKAHPSDPAQDLLFNYTYDDIGNRKTAVENGVSKTYTANDIQQYTEVSTDGVVETLTYDQAGNPDKIGDWDITWDGEDRAKVFTNSIDGTKIEFAYDYRGFVLWKKVLDSGDNVIEHIGYLYDGNLVCDEIDILDNNKVIRSYTWGLDPAGTRQQVGGIGALLAMEETQPDNSVKDFLVVSDAGGNVTNLVESHTDGSLTMANSYEYGPFGQVIAKTEAVEMPYQFNTKMTDPETGLVYYGYRFYDADNGRWLNRDPIGVNGGINLYNSVSNNMVNGYSGGMGYASGMENFLGTIISETNIDSWGLKEIKWAKEGMDIPLADKNGHLLIAIYRPYKAGNPTAYGATMSAPLILKNPKCEGLYRWKQTMTWKGDNNKILNWKGRRMENYIDGNHTFKRVLPKTPTHPFYYSNSEIKKLDLNDRDHRRFLEKKNTNYYRSLYIKRYFSGEKGLPLTDQPFSTYMVAFAFNYSDDGINGQFTELDKDKWRNTFIKEFTVELIKVKNKNVKTGKVMASFKWGYKLTRDGSDAKVEVLNGNN